MTVHAKTFNFNDTVVIVILNNFAELLELRLVFRLLLGH